MYIALENVSFDASKVVPVSAEIRVKTVGLYMCVKN